MSNVNLITVVFKLKVLPTDQHFYCNSLQTPTKKTQPLTNLLSSLKVLDITNELTSGYFYYNYGLNINLKLLTHGIVVWLFGFEWSSEPKHEHEYGVYFIRFQNILCSWLSETKTLYLFNRTRLYFIPFRIVLVNKSYFSSMIS